MIVVLPHSSEEAPTRDESPLRVPKPFATLDTGLCAIRWLQHPEAHLVPSSLPFWHHHKHCPCSFVLHWLGSTFLSPTAESFGVSAQIGSELVWGSPEVRFHEGSTRVPPGFQEVLRGLRGGASTKKCPACCWGYHLSLFMSD